MGTHRFIGKVAATEAAAAATEVVRKQEHDTAITDAKARANHTGTQTAATISDFNSSVDTRVQLIVDAAPAALDTLNELAAALGDDPNFSATVTTSLGDLDTRIDALEAGGSGKRAHTQLVGDAALSSFNVDHNWALADKNRVGVTVIDTVDGQIVYPTIVASTVNRVVVDFGASIPALNQYRVNVFEA